MPRLTNASRAIAQELLDWDMARVAELTARGWDCSVYQARQSAAQAELASDRMPREWPREVVDLFMAVLEVNRAPTPARQHGVRGPVQHPVPARGATEVRLLKKLAVELNVIEKLREVAPQHWAEEEG